MSGLVRVCLSVFISSLFFFLTFCGGGEGGYGRNVAIGERGDNGYIL